MYLAEGSQLIPLAVKSDFESVPFVPSLMPKLGYCVILRIMSLNIDPVKFMPSGG